MTLISLQELEEGYGPDVVSYILTTGTGKLFIYDRWILFVIRPQRLKFDRLVDLFSLEPHPDLKAGRVGTGYELLSQAHDLGVLPRYQRLQTIAHLWQTAVYMQKRNDEQFQLDLADGLEPDVFAQRSKQRSAAVDRMYRLLREFVQTYHHGDLQEIDQGENMVYTGWRLWLRRFRLI